MIWHLFNRGICICMFLLSTAWAVLHRFHYVFIFIRLTVLSKFLVLSWLFTSVLFNFYILVSSIDSFPVSISNFIPGWPKKILCILLIILNLLRLILWPKLILILWSILENVQLHIWKECCSWMKCSLDVVGACQAFYPNWPST